MQVKLALNNMTDAPSQFASKGLEISRQFNVRVANKSQYRRCYDYVVSSNKASIYHLPEWCELIKQIFGHASYYLVAESLQGEIIGILPIVRLKSRLFGDYMVSMPYFNYGGAVAINEKIEKALIDNAINIAKELDSQHIEFRDTGRRDEYPSVRTDKVAMILSLPDNQDILWKKLGAKRRSQINRPLREGVEVKCGTTELLADFYRVFAHNMRDLGTPVYSKKFFSEILKRFSDYAQIICVYHKDEPVSAAFLIGFKGQLEIPWASTLRSVNAIGVNMLLYWEVLKYAIGRGYKTFDFGRSTIDSGTYRFKKQWGAQPKQLYWHYWMNEGRKMPELTPSNPKYQLAIKAWQHLPLFVTNRIGPLIVKNLP